jgi:hypothetical protein
VGKEKGKNGCNEDCKEKGRTYRCRKKETFATYEGSVGSEEKEVVSNLRRIDFAN